MKTTVKPSTLDTLARLEREMDVAGRAEEREALSEALAVLARPGHGLLTTGQAAERLSISIPTVKDWIQRGTLKGVNMGTRWLVSEESVEFILGIRRAFAEMAEEGYPTTEEILELTKRTRRAAREKGENVA